MLEQMPEMKEADDGLIKRGWTSKEVGSCIQNFLCIIEMLFIGVAMHYAFHYTEWASEAVAVEHKGMSPWRALWRGKAVNTVKDLLHDANTVRRGSVYAAKSTVMKAKVTNPGAP